MTVDDGGARRAVVTVVAPALVVVAVALAALGLTGRLPDALVSDATPSPTATAGA